MVAITAAQLDYIYLLRCVASNLLHGIGPPRGSVIATLGGVAHPPTSDALALSAIAAFNVIFFASLPGAALWLMRPSMRQRMLNGPKPR